MPDTFQPQAVCVCCFLFPISLGWLSQCLKVSFEMATLFQFPHVTLLPTPLPSPLVFYFSYHLSPSNVAYN